VLDIGVGTGRNLEKLLERIRSHGDLDISIWGIDISKRMVERTREKLDGGNVSVSLRCGDARKLTAEFEDKYFDIVLLCRVASHLPRIDNFALEVCRILRPGGVVIVSDVDPEHSYTTTRIPCRDRKISVETYKHSLDDWRIRLQQNGLLIGYAKHITTNDVRASVTGDIPSSVGAVGNTPVSFIISGYKP
jgi:SAM-dependent methyltransferase